MDLGIAQDLLATSSLRMDRGRMLAIVRGQLKADMCVLARNAQASSDRRNKTTTGIMRRSLRGAIV